jgi:hypothetical protein
MNSLKEPVRSRAWLNVKSMEESMLDASIMRPFLKDLFSEMIGRRIIPNCNWLKRGDRDNDLRMSLVRGILHEKKN